MNINNIYSTLLFLKLFAKTSSFGNVSSLAINRTKNKARKCNKSNPLGRLAHRMCDFVVQLYGVYNKFRLGKIADIFIGKIPG
jgi:hypothetical protein